MTLPFSIDGAADSLEVTRTFSKDSFETTVTLDEGTGYVELEDFRGGFTPSAIIFTFNVKMYMDAAKTQLFVDSRFLIYGNLNSGNDGIVLKAARYENEGGLSNRVSRALFSFNEKRSEDYIQYKSVSNYYYDATNTNNIVSTILSAPSATKDHFIIRKRSMNNLLTSGEYGHFGDQFFSTTYDSSSQEFGASESSKGFANGTSGQTNLSFNSADSAGLGNVIDTNDVTNFNTVENFGDFSFIKAENMYNFNDDILPTSKDDLTPNW